MKHVHTLYYLSSFACAVPQQFASEVIDVKALFSNEDPSLQEVEILFTVCHSLYLCTVSSLNLLRSNYVSKLVQWKI